MCRVTELQNCTLVTEHRLCLEVWKTKWYLSKYFCLYKKKKKLETRQSFKVVNLFENSQPAHKHSVKCGQGKFNIFSLENSATYII